MQFASLKLLYFAILLAVIFVWSQWSFGQRLAEVEATPIATASQIRELQSDEKNKDRFVIVDVRSKAETDVSVIPGALTKSQFENTANQHRNKSVIVYCTIGVRSGNYAAELNRKGWKAQNYKGSIIDWCKNNFPLTHDGKETNRVHTYSPKYAVNKNYVAVY